MTRLTYAARRGFTCGPAPAGRGLSASWALSGPRTPAPAGGCGQGRRRLAGRGRGGVPAGDRERNACPRGVGTGSGRDVPGVAVPEPVQLVAVARVPGEDSGDAAVADLRNRPGGVPEFGEDPEAGLPDAADRRLSLGAYRLDADGSCGRTAPGPLTPAIPLERFPCRWRPRRADAGRHPGAGGPGRGPDQGRRRHRAAHAVPGAAGAHRGGRGRGRVPAGLAVIRPAGPGDRAAIAEFLEGLSPAVRGARRGLVPAAPARGHRSRRPHRRRGRPGGGARDGRRPGGRRQGRRRDGGPWRRAALRLKSAACSSIAAQRTAAQADTRRRAGRQCRPAPARRRAAQ